MEFVADLLRVWQLGDKEHEYIYPIYKRFAKVMGDGRRSMGMGDITSLTRQVLKLDQELQGGGDSRTVRVPKGPEWPTKTDWAKSNVNVISETSEHLVIRLELWVPNWLKDVPPQGLDHGIQGITGRREYARVNGDPFLKQAGFKSYNSDGQREAIRAVLMMPDKATLAISLPTGSGKSLCGHLLGLMDPDEKKTTIVVVPTTSLSIDQEAELKSMISHPTSYYSQNSEDGKLKNKEIRQRLLNGTQRILFTSPESLQQSLKWAVCKAAENGMIKALVIDEAHVVADWGDGFRPAFQSLSGLRKFLLSNETAGFPTLLLSATFTQSTLELLERLFGSPGPFRTIATNVLRPEPNYWFRYCFNQEQKFERVLEALHNLPRPIIVYTTIKDEATELASYLKSNGLKRIENYTGSTTTRKRESLSDQWRNGDIDIMVATSAFGLGINQSELRCVIHACMPETVDRYYQEVGRAGRDGNASLALMLYTKRDIEVAAGMSRETLIGTGKGWSRWNTMFSNAQLIPADSGTAAPRFVVPTDLPPGLEADQIDMDSAQNSNWYPRTLALMVRSGLIDWSLELPTRQVLDENPDESGSEVDNENPDSSFHSRVVEIKDDGHFDETHWKKIVEENREREYKSDGMAFDLFRKLINDPASRCISEVLAETYTLNTGQVGVTDVAMSCGGCPSCRSISREPFSSTPRIPSQVWENPLYELGGVICDVYKDLNRNNLDVFYGTNDDLTDAIIKLLIQRFQNLIAPEPQIAKWLEKLGPEFFSRPIFVNDSFPPNESSCIPLPTIYYCPQGSSPDVAVRTAIPYSVRFIPEDALDKQGRLLIDVVTPSPLVFPEFARRIDL